MNLADKPYAELMRAVVDEYNGKRLVGILRAAKVLPPERAQMMLAAAVVALADVSSSQRALDTIDAFIEEARWRAL